MTEANRRFILLPASEGEFVLLNGKAGRRLSAAQAFASGYRLLRRGRREDADLVLQMLSLKQPADPDVLILLARCRAAVKDRFGCAAVLRSVCGPQHRLAAEQIHAAFVFDALDVFPREAIGHLKKAVRSRSDCPVLCLLLGDMCSDQGRTAEAMRYWRLAVRRARGAGPVARLARQHIARLREKTLLVSSPSRPLAEPRPSPTAIASIRSRSSAHGDHGPLCRL